MKHVNDGKLMAFIDGALGPSEQAIVAQHIEGCYECRQRVDQLCDASERVGHAIALLTPEEPLDFDEVERAARTVQTRAARERLPSGKATLARAAALILGFATLASAAIPGSPIREWVSGIVADESQDSAIHQSQNGTSIITDQRAGVSVRPTSGRLTVRIVDAEEGSMLRLRLVDEERATIHTRAARYRTGPGAIDIVNPTSQQIRLDLPRAADDVTVTIDGRVVVTKVGDSLNWVTPEMDSDSEVLLPIGAGPTLRVPRPMPGR